MNYINITCVQEGNELTVTQLGDDVELLFEMVKSGWVDDEIKVHLRAYNARRVADLLVDGAPGKRLALESGDASVVFELNGTRRDRGMTVHSDSSAGRGPIDVSVSAEDCRRFEIFMSQLYPKRRVLSASQDSPSFGL